MRRVLAAFVLANVALSGPIGARASTWTTNGPLGGRAEALAIDPVSPSTVYAGVIGGGLFKSTNAGASWSVLTNGLTQTYSIEVLAIDPSSTSVVYAGTGNGHVFKTTNAGTSWSDTSTGLPGHVIFSLVIDPTNTNVLYAGAYGGGVFKTTNGGATWSAVNTGLTDFVVTTLVMNPASPSTVYAGTAYGGVFKTATGGASWTAVNTGFPSTSISTLAIDPTSPNTLYAGSFLWGIFKTTNGGTSWAPADSGIPSGGRWVWYLTVNAASPSTVYAGTAAGVYKTTNGGTSWAGVNTGFPSGAISDQSATVLAIDPGSSSTIYAGMEGGGFFKTTNAGGLWGAINVGLTGSEIEEVVVDPLTPTTVYAMPYDNGVFKTTNGGVSWTAVNTGITWDIVWDLAIDPATPSTLWAGTQAGIFKSTTGGGSWTLLAGAPTYALSLAIDPTNTNVVYAASDADVFKTTNGGGSWTPVSTGLPGSGIRVVTLDPSNPNTLYAGTGGDGVFKSTNAGATWSAANTGLTIGNVWHIEIAPSSPSSIYAAEFFSNTAFKTTDGGASWNALSPVPSSAIYDLTVDPTNPNTLYAAGAYAGVFKSSNGGLSWVPVATNGMTNGFVTSLAVDLASTNGLYAGTHGGVFRLQAQCGDALLEGSEQCDNGPGNGTDGCCTATCTKVAGSTCIGTRSTGATCDPANTCTLTTPDGRMSITIPPGALDTPTVVEIIGKNVGDRTYKLGTGSQVVLVADMLPAGLQFNNGNEATLRFNWIDAVPPVDCTIDGTQIYEADLQISRDGFALTKVCGTRDPVTGVCTAAAFGGTRCASGTLTLCKAAGCNFDQNTFTVDVKRFSEYALTRPCTPVEAGTMTIKKLDTPAGDDRLLLKGTLERPPGAPLLDLFTDGLSFSLIDADETVLDVVIPGDAYSSVSKSGWKLNANATKWTYVNKNASPPGGITKVLLTLRGSQFVDVLIKGKDGAYAVTPAVEASIVPANGECYGSRWPGVGTQAICQLNASGSTLKCKPGTASVTTTTSTTSTTLLNGIPCSSAATPTCDGACPPEQYCTQSAGVCVCATQHCELHSLPPECSGDCGGGGACVDDGVGGCVCSPALVPCESSSAPTCDGQCAPGQYCQNFGGTCGCFDYSCGAVEGAPSCSGLCPTETPTCVDTGGTCQCM